MIIFNGLIVSPKERIEPNDGCPLFVVVVHFKPEVMRRHLVFGVKKWLVALFFLFCCLLEKHLNFVVYRVRIATKNRIKDNIGKV
jgi:hypothetical protein